MGAAGSNALASGCCTAAAAIVGVLTTALTKARTSEGTDCGHKPRFPEMTLTVFVLPDCIACQCDCTTWIRSHMAYLMLVRNFDLAF